MGTDPAGSTSRALLGEWDVAWSRPRPDLRRYVSFYSGYRQRGGAPGRHRGLPSPYLTVILTLDEPLLLADGPEAPATRRYDALVAGLHTTPTHIAHPGRQAGVQLGLTPLGARALLGVPAAELAGRDLMAADVLGGAVSAARERLLAAGSWPECFAVLDGWLAARLDVDAGQRVEVAHAWRLLTSAAGPVPVARVAALVGWSPRHLQARLLAETGLTPKAAARVARFDRARRRLGREFAAGRRGGLAALAADCGYADQAHLTREFREMAGCPPSVWLAEEFRYVQATADPPAAEYEA